MTEKRSNIEVLGVSQKIVKIYYSTCTSQWGQSLSLYCSIFLDGMRFHHNCTAVGVETQLLLRYIRDLKFTFNDRGKVCAIMYTLNCYMNLISRVSLR